MSRTMWLALFCIVGLGPAIAIKLAAPPPTLVVEPGQDRSGFEPAFAPNELAKADRLELLADTSVKTEVIVPTKPVAAESSSTNLETVKKVDIDQAVVHRAPLFDSGRSRHANRNWRNANAKMSPVEPLRRQNEGNEAKQSTGKPAPNKTAEVWHCREDAIGGLLRSLDLSPRCNL